MKFNTLSSLPEKIKIKLVKVDSGFIAELPEYDVFTECSNPIDIILNVNDLIYTFFDIPKKLHGKIFYAPRPPAKAKPVRNGLRHPYLLVKVVEQKNEDFRIKRT